MKKIISMFLAMMVLTSFSIVGVYADSAKSSENKVGYSKTVYMTSLSDSEISDLLEQQAQQEIQSKMAARQAERATSEGLLKGPPPTTSYVTEYGAEKLVPVSGWAGNQLAGGYMFPTGGGFWYGESGGPTITATFTWPTPYGTIRISGTAGNKATSGQWVDAPTKTSYYKLWVTKNYKCKPYVVYAISNVTGKKTEYDRGMVQYLYSSKAEAKAV